MRIMCLRVSLPVLLFCLFNIGLARGEDETPTKAPPKKEASPLERALRGHVERLASKELHGRAARADRSKAADYIAKAFKEAGLKPAPGQKTLFYDQGGEEGAPDTRHVVGWLDAAPDSKLREEYLLLGAHLDGIGKYLETDKDSSPGANDNATGVAALIEIARSLAAPKGTDPAVLPRCICFVAFDRKMRGLPGVLSFVEAPPVPLERCAAVVTTEMLGRAFLDACSGWLFVMGGEHSAQIAGHVSEAGRPEGGHAAVFGSDFHMETGLYRPFRDRKIPFLYVSGGFTLDRWSARDTAERIDYAQHAARTTWLRGLVARIAGDAQRPKWRKQGDPDISEMNALRAMAPSLRKALESRGASEPLLKNVDATIKEIDRLIEKGAVTKMERNMVMLRMGAVALRAYVEGKKARSEEK